MTAKKLNLSAEKKIMEITINDFGPIDSITFDLSKDFHLIYGQNSIGKSYATYCLYCIIKNVTKKRIQVDPFYHRNNPDYNEFKEKLKNNLKQLRAKKIKDDVLNEMAGQFLTQELEKILIPGIKNSLRNTFSSLQVLRNGYSKNNYSFNFKVSDNSGFEIISDKKGNPSLSLITVSNNWKFVEKSTKTTKFSLYNDSKMFFGKPTEDEFILEFVTVILTHIEMMLNALDSGIRDIYYLPASRSGLYQALNSFTPILAELTQNRFFINSKKIELPSLSEPLSDYFIDISTLDKNNINKQYNNVIANIEKNILEGSIRFDDQSKKIKYKPNHLGFELDISEVSSMISEISPIVIYLKHILHHKFSSDSFHTYYPRSYRSQNKKYDIIFIEEPEAHLHPEVQVKLTEIFVELTKLDIKIIMTSHSNFMFNKINNMIIGKQIRAKDIAVYHLIKTQNGSAVNDKMSLSEEGIIDENFTDVSKKLYEERLDSLED